MVILFRAWAMQAIGSMELGKMGDLGKIGDHGGDLEQTTTKRSIEKKW
jgi:hypothetical protein